MIFDKSCKHDWIKRKYISSLTNKLKASWETCAKCGSEKNRKVYP